MYPPTCTNASKLLLLCHQQPSALSRIRRFNGGSENGESSPLSALLVLYLWEDEKHYLLPRQRISQLDEMIYRMNNHIMMGMRQVLNLLQLCIGWSCIKWSHLVITVASCPASGLLQNITVVPLFIQNQPYSFGNSTQKHCHLPAHWSCLPETVPQGSHSVSARRQVFQVLGKHLPWKATVIIDLYRKVFNKLQEDCVSNGMTDNCCWIWWNRLFMNPNIICIFLKVW